VLGEVHFSPAPDLCVAVKECETGALPWCSAVDLVFGVLVC